jgi:hypothetical protein
LAISLEEEREGLERRIFMILRDFEERTGRTISEIQLLREELLRPASDEKASVLLGVRVETVADGQEPDQ